MNIEGFQQFMKSQRRSAGTIDSCVLFTQVFETYLTTNYDGLELDQAQPEHLDAFLVWGKPVFGSMNSQLWAISRYYDYTGNATMRRYADQLRSQRIEKKRPARPSLRLSEIAGVEAETIAGLKKGGLTTVRQLLEVANTRDARAFLSEVTGIPYEAIERTVKLADLCRISDIKGLRVRLLFDAGFDTIEKIAAQDPGAMREQIIRVNQREHIAARDPTMTEAKFWVEQAKKLPKLIEL